MLKGNPDPRVRALTVWQPMQGGQEEHVAEATATMPDPRVRHFWDGEGVTLKAFAAPLALPPLVAAWDLYLIYPPGVRWDGPSPPAPAFWMHQLMFVENGPPLDGAVFAARLAATLEAGPGAGPSR